MAPGPGPLGVIQNVAGTALNQQVDVAAANLPNANAAAIQQRHKPVRPHIKLLEIKLTKFKGDQDEWLGWWNTFRTSIHDQDMEPTAKFAYLQTFLRGTRSYTSRAYRQQPPITTL